MSINMDVRKVVIYGFKDYIEFTPDEDEDYVRVRVFVEKPDGKVEVASSDLFKKVDLIALAKVLRFMYKSKTVKHSYVRDKVEEGIS